MTSAQTENASSAKRMLWIGAIGAGVAALAGMLGTHDGSLWRLPRALEMRVEQALSDAGYGGVDVAMDGQRALLRGIVPDEAAIAAARTTALRAAGAGGPWAGGVTHVDASGVSVGEVARPFAWTVARRGQRLVLSGAVSSEEARASLMAIATSHFPNAEIVDQMRTAGGAPSSNWSDMAGNVIRAIATLNEGEGRMVDREIALIGDGSYAAVERLRTDYAAPLPPYHARLAASVDGLDLSYPELQGLDLRAPTPRVCANAFARVLDGAGVTFAAGSAAITAPSRAALDALISVALRCDANRITMVGPAEGGGDLSRTRARALMDYLIAQGVSPAHLQAAAGSQRALSIAVDAPEAAQP